MEWSPRLTVKIGKEEYITDITILLKHIYTNTCVHTLYIYVFVDKCIDRYLCKHKMCKNRYETGNCGYLRKGKL